MKKLLKKLEDVYAASAFAEAGEFETAKQILREEDRPEKTDRQTPVKRIRKGLRAPGLER